MNNTVGRVIPLPLQRISNRIDAIIEIGKDYTPLLFESGRDHTSLVDSVLTLACDPKLRASILSFYSIKIFPKIKDALAKVHNLETAIEYYMVLDINGDYIEGELPYKIVMLSEEQKLKRKVAIEREIEDYETMFNQIACIGLPNLSNSSYATTNNRIGTTLSVAKIAVLFKILNLHTSSKGDGIAAEGSGILDVNYLKNPGKLFEDMVCSLTARDNKLINQSTLNKEYYEFSNQRLCSEWEQVFRALAETANKLSDSWEFRGVPKRVKK